MRIPRTIQKAILLALSCFFSQRGHFIFLFFLQSSHLNIRDTHIDIATKSKRYIIASASAAATIPMESSNLSIYKAIAIINKVASKIIEISRIAFLP